MGTLNADGLWVKFGTEKTLPNRGGEYATRGDVREIEVVINLPTLNQNEVVQSDQVFVPAGVRIQEVEVVTDVVAATGDYTQKTKEATKALSAVSDAYSNAANSATAFNNASEGAKIFHNQVQVLTKNLSSLNTIYELELQESNNHLKALNQFYGKLTETSKAMVSTADDANKAKEQIAMLASNLHRLNQIYGNMIGAMQVK